VGENLQSAEETERSVCLTAKRNVTFVSRLMGRRKPKLTRTVENLTAAVIAAHCAKCKTCFLNQARLPQRPQRVCAA
jgi:hypothetical protein